MSNEQPPKRTRLLQLLRETQGTQFVIPVYQRNYTWTRQREVKQYLEDLKSVISGKYPNHFIGILIYLDKALDYRSREFSIIDGQQRLTTTFLILYSIKYLMLERGENKKASDLDNLYLTNPFSDEKIKFKLKPLVNDDEVYQQIVNEQISSISNKTSNVYRNFQYIKDTIQEWLVDYSFNDILMALDKLYVVCVPVSEDDNPQKIFESINSTGTRLSDSDLIRNFILMNMNSDTQEKLYSVYWKEIEKNISSDSKKLEAFFRYFLAAKQKFLSNSNAVYSSFKEWYASEKSNKSVEDILKEIVDYSRYYSVIYLIPIGDVGLDIRESIEEFRKNLSDMPAPFLIEIYSLYDSKDEEGKHLISSKQFNEIVNILNCYLVRRSICGLNTNVLSRLFPLLLKDVLRECNGNYENIVDYVKKNLVNKNRGKAAEMPDDEQLKNYLRYANVYSQKSTLRVIFEKIETSDNPAPVDFSKLSIEHLMPQTPTKEWLEYLNVDNDTYEKNLHRLGNLTLATRVDNSKMKNKPFEYKQEILSDTEHLKMNKYILHEKEWKIEQINERTEKLLEKIIKLYPYQSASDEVIVKHDIFLDTDGVCASGILYEEDGSVEIQEGSEIVKYEDENSSSDSQLETYQQLLDGEIIKETENGAVFTQSYTFNSQRIGGTALSLTAGIILGGTRNGWTYWKDSSGHSLSEDSKLKKKFKEN